MMKSGLHCPACGKAYTQKKKDQKTCGKASCRQWLRRDRVGLEKAVLEAMKQLDIISSYLHESDQVDMKARRALAEVRNYADGKLSL